MKVLQIIKNSKGEVVGTSEVLRNSAATVSLIPEKDEKVFELEVPDDFALEQRIKIQLLKDSNGNVLASLERDGRTSDAVISPELGKNEYLEEVEESGHYVIELDAFLKKHSKKKG